MIAKTRKIYINGLHINASVGMLDHERLARQPLLVYGEFETDASIPVDDKNIDTVLDYRQLRSSLINDIANAHTDLLETLSERCLQTIMNDFASVSYAKIRICKPQAFDDIDAVCVEQTAKR